MFSGKPVGGGQRITLLRHLSNLMKYPGFKLIALLGKVFEVQETEWCQVVTVHAGEVPDWPRKWEQLPWLTGTVLLQWMLVRATRCYQSHTLDTFFFFFWCLITFSAYFSNIKSYWILASYFVCPILSAYLYFTRTFCGYDTVSVTLYYEQAHIRIPRALTQDDLIYLWGDQATKPSLTAENDLQTWSMAYSSVVPDPKSSRLQCSTFLVYSGLGLFPFLSWQCQQLLLQ